MNTIIVPKQPNFVFFAAKKAAKKAIKFFIDLLFNKTNYQFFLLIGNLNRLFYSGRDYIK